MSAVCCYYMCYTTIFLHLDVLKVHNQNSLPSFFSSPTCYWRWLCSLSVKNVLSRALCFRLNYPGQNESVGHWNIQNEHSRQSRYHLQFENYHEIFFSVSRYLQRWQQTHLSWREVWLVFRSLPSFHLIFSLTASTIVHLINCSETSPLSMQCVSFDIWLRVYIFKVTV